MLTSTDALAIGGSFRPDQEPDYKPCIVLLNDDLSVRAYHIGQGPKGCRTNCMAENSNGDFVLAGYFGQDAGADIFVEKIAGGFSQTTAIGKDVSEVPYLLFPNPFNTVQYLKIGTTQESKTLRLYASDGKMVREIAFSSNEYLLYKNNLAPGVYLMTISDDHEKLIVSDRVVVE